MVGKRQYTLGKRQASVDETRRRIIASAAEEYQVNGIEDTSMQAVARRADVAPGTVLYHFPDPGELAEAVIDSWITEMEMPTPAAIDPAASLDERIRTLVEELFGLYERSEPAYRVYQQSSDHPAMSRANAMWETNVSAMLAPALGKRNAEPETLQVVAAVVSPGFRAALLMSGLTSVRSKEVATELVMGWFSR
ncbi:hypothetical protein BH23ACT4_BH23ACT4_13480 [soil metagenome]